MSGWHICCQENVLKIGSQFTNSWRSYYSSDGQEISPILWTPLIQYHVDKLPLDSYLSWMNSVHIITPVPLILILLFYVCLGLFRFYNLSLHAFLSYKDCTIYLCCKSLVFIFSTSRHIMHTVGSYVLRLNVQSAMLCWVVDIDGSCRVAGSRDTDLLLIGTCFWWPYRLLIVQPC